MNTLIVWFVVAVPKQSCLDKMNAQRSQLSQQLYEVSKSSQNWVKVEALRKQIDSLPPLPQLVVTPIFQEPTTKMGGDCFDVYSEKRKLYKVQ